MWWKIMGHGNVYGHIWVNFFVGKLFFLNLILNLVVLYLAWSPALLTGLTGRLYHMQICEIFTLDKEGHFHSVPFIIKTRDCSINEDFFWGGGGDEKVIFCKSQLKSLNVYPRRNYNGKQMMMQLVIESNVFCFCFSFFLRLSSTNLDTTWNV